MPGTRSLLPQAHEASPIRCMEFSHSGLFLLSCDDAGRVKFSRPTLEVLQVYQAHKEPCRAVTFSPTDYKFATGGWAGMGGSWRVGEERMA